MDILFFILVTMFSLLGVMTAINGIIYHLFKTEEGSVVEIICLSGKNAEMILRGNLANLRWRKEKPRHKILVLDLGLDKENKEICEKLCLDYSIQFCKRESLFDYLGD